MDRLTRSRGIELDTLNEQADVVPPRPRTTVCVTQPPPESTVPPPVCRDVCRNVGRGNVGARIAAAARLVDALIGGEVRRGVGGSVAGRRVGFPIGRRVARIDPGVRARRSTAAAMEGGGQQAREGESGELDAHPPVIV